MTETNVKSKTFERLSKLKSSGENALKSCWKRVAKFTMLKGMIFLIIIVENKNAQYLLWIWLLIFGSMVAIIHLKKKK